MALRMGALPFRCRQIPAKSSFFGIGRVLLHQRVAAPTPSASRPVLPVLASGRKCELTGKKANNGYNVTFSHIRNKKLQHVNLQYKKVYWPEAKRMVRLRLSTKAIKTLEKKGLQVMAKEAGLDLYSLPYTDVSPSRLLWLAENHKGNPAQPRKIGRARRMKNPDKLAASKKRPLQARYLAGGRVILTRDPKYVEEYQG